MSLIALRKADEIQKLAKNLKERMKEEGQVSEKINRDAPVCFAKDVRAK